MDTIYEGGKNVEVWASDNHAMAMMPKELGCVVDTRMRMYGTENVRVVGAFWLFFFLFRIATMTIDHD